MRNDLLKRDYPLSETRIDNEEGKKKSSDAKKASIKQDINRLEELRAKRHEIGEKVGGVMYHWLNEEIRKESKK